MRSIVNKDDYIGFIYAGHHSSEFGIKSVTSGDRYQRYLSPEFTDITQNLTGHDGTYYFGENKVKKTFNINAAFDDVTEQEYREIKLWLNSGIAELIFDEQPYIKYYAKLQNTVPVNFLPFNDADGRRIYKGEIDLTFVSYDGYGHIVSKWLDDYNNTGFNMSNTLGIQYQSNTVFEWGEASRLLPRATYKNITYDTYNNGNINIYNPGDIETNWIITVPYITNNNTTISLKDKNDTILSTLEFDFSSLSSYNIYSGGTITINSKKRLVTLSKTNLETLVINKCHKAGDYFKIPVNELNDYNKIVITNATVGQVSPTIEYDYLYL